MEECQRCFRRLRRRLSVKNTKNLMDGISEDILMNRYQNITKSYIRPQSLKLEPHPTVQIDPTCTRDAEGFIKERPARSASEALLGTAQTHTNWTNTAGESVEMHGAAETKDAQRTNNFWFKKNPSAPSKAEIRDLFRPDLQLSDNVHEIVHDAHNPATFELFNLPKPNTDFLYKYTVDPKNPEINYEKVEEKFNKFITGTPGSARHKGFHLAVIGRMPFKWSRHWLKGISYILTARIAPKVVKKLTRLPLPKKGIGQTRPISLVHDIWGFINTIIYDDLSEALERAKCFDDDILAYRKGRSAIDPMITIIALLEECYVSGELIGFVSEDEEKYFDRVTHVLQVLSMLKVGIPREGYIEIKAEDMTERECTIVTSIGKVTIKYKVGLPQGQTLSVINCNLVSRIKVMQWRLFDPKNPIKHRGGFFFGCKDSVDAKHDRIVNVQKKVYSDDATGFFASNGNEALSFEERRERNFSTEPAKTAERHQRTQELLQTSNAMVNMTGNSSIVYKAPHHAHKSSIYLANIDSEIINTIPPHVNT